MKKKVIFISILALLTGSVPAIALATAKNNQSFVRATDGVYWNHYEQVTPTLLKHGSKEFWANCSTHAFVLENPGPGEDIREGVAFDTLPYFDELTSEDPRYLPPLSERVDIKEYLDELLEAMGHDPYSYIPNSMRPEGVTHYSEPSLTYDFTNFTNVNSIKYGGFGEQWHMVIDNIKESKFFYNISNYGSVILSASYLLASTFLDDYYDNTVDKTFSSDARFVSKLVFDGSILTYSVLFKSGITVPLFGTITPQIDTEYNVDDNIKTIRIQLGENNAMKYVIAPGSYSFGLEYGISSVSRKAYLTMTKDSSDNIEGHIFEFVQYKDKELVPACVDFYIDEDYASVVGNKASGIPGFAGYINELYLTENGELLGYEIRETKTISKLTAEYNTLWFNLNNISGISNVKHDDKFYVNNSGTEFKTKDFGGLNTKRFSRRYDIEERLQYFYDEVAEEIVEYETSIPMMFVQEEKLADFASDVTDENSYLSVAITLANDYLTKIEDDYDTLIDVFIANKDSVDAEYIVTYIGDPAIF